MLNAMPSIDDSLTTNSDKYREIPELNLKPTRYLILGPIFAIDIITVLGQEVVLLTFSTMHWQRYDSILL